LIGAALGFTHIDPIKMLFWAAVINGFVAVPVMVAMMIMASRTALMGEYRLGLGVAVAGWAATGLMAIAAGFLVWSMIG
jgi:Mn2+/Fe2+ NRAMP family transporter